MALDDVLAQIEKQYGKGTIIKLGDRPMEIDVVPTGILPLDMALGVGGIPRGRITEIFGNESAGKTTLALNVIAEAQKQEINCAYIDAEHSLGAEYAEAIGVNLPDLYMSQPSTAEQSLDLTEQLVRSGEVGVVVIDSVAAMVPRAEVEGEFGDLNVGLMARLMSQAMRKLTAVAGNTNASIIFINQIREKVGISYGNPEVTPGGRALKFFSSLRIEMRKGEPIKSGESIVGNKVKVKVVKSKVAAPFKTCELDLIYNEGISKEASLLDAGLEMGLIQKAGSWFAMGDEKLGQGRLNVFTFLKDNPETANKLLTQIREEQALFSK